MPHAVSVLVVDDHPALRAGLLALLSSEPGIEALGAVHDAEGLAAAVERRVPDVVVIDHALTAGDGLAACLRLKQRPDPPGVVLYSTFADAVFGVPAAAAQADAVVHKGAPVQELLDAIRDVADGLVRTPPPDPELVHAVAVRVPPEDLTILGMLIARMTVAQIAATLGCPDAEAGARAMRILGELQAPERALVA